MNSPPGTQAIPGCCGSRVWWAPIAGHPSQGGPVDSRAVGDAIGQMLPIAVGIAVSPLPIVAVVLMLATPRGRVDGPAFVAA